jgi:raffinose/stachyose/melibiose transport system permease protein
VPPNGLYASRNADSSFGGRNQPCTDEPNRSSACAGSMTEGASGPQKFRYVTLPLLAPAITINVVLSTMGVLGAYDLPTTLSSGGGPAYYGTTMAILVIRYVYESYQKGKALSVAVVMSLIAIVLSYIELKLLVKREVHT